MKQRVLTGFSAVTLLFAGLGETQAASSTDADLPSQPNPPPALFRRVAPEGFHCERTFVYEGKTYGCDSNFRPDGEGLRPILKDEPAATSSLNTYQHRRSSLMNVAYFGSLGMASLIAGALGGSGNGKQLMLFSGAGVLGGSFLYGLASLRANEGNLDQAVKLHNDAKPQQPIELQFSTGISF